MSSIFELPKKIFCVGSRFLVLSVSLVCGSVIAQTSPLPLTAPPKQIPAIEQGALDIIKQMSTKLSSAKTLQFQARVQSDAPSIDGIPVIYTSNSDFAIQRPNKMAVMTSGQGLPSELIYDGKSIVAITPNTEIVAFSKAPGNIDDMGNSTGFPKQASKFGVGLDLGFVYEWRPDWKEYKYDMDGETNLWRRDQEKYKIRAGVSIVDIGGMKFQKGGLSRNFSVNSNNLFNLHPFFLSCNFEFIFYTL